MSQIETAAAGTSTAAAELSPGEMEQFIKRGLDAQSAVDELLAKMFAPAGLKPTAGQLARFTAQLAEAERCEQRVNELLGEVNRLRAQAKNLRKAAPKILRELPQQELPFTAATPPAHDDLMHQRAIESAGSDAARTSLPVLQEMAELDRITTNQEAGVSDPAAEVPPAIELTQSQSIDEPELHAGGTYAAADFSWTPGKLDELLNQTILHPNGAHADADIVGADWDSCIHSPIRIQHRTWAVVRGSVNSERRTWTLREVAFVCKDSTRKLADAHQSWGKRRQSYPKCAPEEVPITSIRAHEPRGNQWWMFEPHQITLHAAPLPHVALGPDGGGRDTDQPERPIQTPAKPAGQSMSWHQWAQAVRQTAVRRMCSPALCNSIEPAGNWLDLYERGLKPVEALEKYQHDREADEQDDARAFTIADLKKRGEGDAIPLMEDENVNDHGVYVRGIQRYRIQCPQGASASIEVAKSCVDGMYRAAHHVDYGSGGGGSAPSVTGTGFSSLEYAVRTKAQAILSYFKKVHPDSAAAKKRLSGAIAAVEKFIASNPHCQVRSQAPSPKRTKADRLVFDGLKLGLVAEKEQRKNCCDRVGISSKNDPPPQIETIDIDGTLWAVTGSSWGADEVGASLKKLLPPADFDFQYPGQQRDPKTIPTNPDLYHGIRVTVRGRGPMIMTRECADITWPAEEIEDDDKPAAGKPRQTLNQWLSSVKSALNGRKLGQLARNANQTNDELVKAWETGKSPREGADVLSGNPKEKARK